MTVKKMSKILTFILVLAMVLSTVAMAAEPPYTVSAPADSLTHGKITITYDTPDSEKGCTKTVNGFLNSTTTSIKLPNDVKKIKVSFTANPGYEFVSAT